MLILKGYIETMTDYYFDLTDAIEQFEKKPTKKNQKKVIEASNIFGLTKRRLVQKVRDCLCGEE